MRTTHDIQVIYRVFCSSKEIDTKARALAIEQSVEMPLEAIEDEAVRDVMAGRVEGIEDSGSESFLVRIALNAASAGQEAGQLINILFGNSSIHEDVVLEDAELPAKLVQSFGGPAAGIKGLSARVKAEGRAMTCAAIKPQGLSPEALARLAERFALGGIDFIKDDHSLADQKYSPFAARIAACAAAVRRANAETGRLTRYVPNISGNLDALRRQIAAARDEGLDTVLMAPMISGLPAFHTLTREFPSMAFIAHPAMAGAGRIAPPFLLGKLFRLFGADAIVFPNYGGRFGYSPATCRALAEAARSTWHGLKPCLPVPAGGMTLDRIAEILDFYGRDTMVLVGGGLLAARERLTEAASSFVRQVASHWAREQIQ